MVGEGDQVALADAVVDVGELGFVLSEFSVLEAEVLGAGVEAVDLLVGGVGDERDVADGVFLGELCPGLDGVLGGLAAGVGDVQCWSAVAFCCCCSAVAVCDGLAETALGRRRSLPARQSR